MKSTCDFRYTSPGLEDYQIKWFAACKRPFTVTRTTYSTKLKSDKFQVILSDRRLWFNHLALITKLKAFVRNNVPDPGEVRARRVYDYNAEKFGPVEGWIKPVMESDLSGAYISCARRLSLINQELFEKVRDVNKFYRLKILGSLGSRKQVTEYDARGLVTGRKTVYDSKLRNVWQKIVQSVNDDMLEQQRSDPLWVFYWVDNYFTQSTSSKVLIFNEIGYGVKTFQTDVVYRKQSEKIGFFLPDERMFQMPRKDRPVTKPEQRRDFGFEGNTGLLEPLYQYPEVSI